MDKKTQKTMFSSAAGDWGTPRWLFDLLNQEFGFWLDAAAQDDEEESDYFVRRDEAIEMKRAELRVAHGLAHDDALTAEAIGQLHEYIDSFKQRVANFKCDRYYTEKDDAFKQDWSVGSGGKPAWLNPPYGRGIGRWMELVKRQSQKITVVTLIPARTDTGWFWDHVIHGAHEVRLLRGRLRFEGAESGAPFPSAVGIYLAGDPPPEARLVPWNPPRPKGAVIEAKE